MYTIIPVHVYIKTNIYKYKKSAHQDQIAQLIKVNTNIFYMEELVRILD